MDGEDAPAPAGGPPLLRPAVTKPGLAWRGIELYPSGNPEEYARRKARVFAPPARTLCFVPSVGLGYGLRELLETLPEGCAVLCVEAFQEVMALAIAQGLPDDPRLLVVRTDSTRGVSAALHKLGVHRFRRVLQVPLSAGYRLAPRLYGTLHAALAEGVRRFWQNRITLMAMGSLQVRNLLSNLPSLGDALDFSALSSALPVVVAGAGPSLEESIPWLLRLRGRYTLCAVDTALPTLRASGLQPDVIVALEAQVANLQDFVGQAGDGGTLLACDLCSHPSALRLFPGRTALFSSAFAPLSLFERLSAAGLLPTTFPALGSVGVAAVHAALRITRAEVFATGLDFSFPGKRTHARGSPTHLAMLARCMRQKPVGQESYAALALRPLVTAPSKSGGEVLTDSLLRSYRDSLEADIEESAGRVCDLGATGLPFGAVPINHRELEQRLGARGAGETLPCRDEKRRFRTDSLRVLVEGENDLLGAAYRALGERLAAGGAQGDGSTAPGGSRAAPAAVMTAEDPLTDMLRRIDYTWAHFPEFPDPNPAAPGFLARVQVAAGYYRQRLARVLSVL